MKKKFILEGLNCANCAAKIEREISILDGVESASINLITTKLLIEGKDENMLEIIRLAESIVGKYEPDVIFKSA